MKIRNVDVKISVVSLTVFIFFTLILLTYVFLTNDWHTLMWGLPSVLLLVVIPMVLNYMSQDQYANLLPIYEAESKKVGIRSINLSMKGQPVRINGVVEAVHFKYLNRPQYIVADKSGSISVKMFTNPSEDINKDDVVEALGTVIKRYLFTGDAVVNCVSIRKIDPKQKK